ncbi:Structural maintenance of chromosomes protein 5 [Massospora cicadina]|nr:Structural maintenance of chromosomes protein 5 [Massospora cicadina]
MRRDYSKRRRPQLGWDTLSPEELTLNHEVKPPPSPDGEPEGEPEGEVHCFPTTQNLQWVPPHQMRHRPGSILRIKLEHFVTYDRCEFFPGPNMNMVIGPNGTGKSTIVCAIALGLGGAPGVRRGEQVDRLQPEAKRFTRASGLIQLALVAGADSLLGRAKELSEFVKHGKQRATIEIELQGHPTASSRDPTVTITRIISRENNTSVWRLNGVTAPLKEVLSLTRGFNIQVDNLCQFLPQDKVAEFAEMGPPELLLATQKAAGEADMHATHTRLIQLRREQKEAATALESDRTHLETLVSAHEKIKREIQKYQEREGVLRRIKLYQMRLGIKRYEVAKEKYLRAQARNAKASAAKEAVYKRQQPLTKALEKAEAAVKEADLALKTLDGQLRPREAKLANARSRLEKLTETSDQAKRALAAGRAERGTHAQDIRRLEGLVRKLQALVDAGPPNQDELPQLSAEIKELNREIIELQHLYDAIQNEQAAIQTDGTQLNQQLSALNQRIRHQDNVDQQRQNALAKVDPATGEAMAWLDENRALFREHVFRPLILEVSVKDSRYADAVENSFNSRIVKAFLCQNKDDYDVFTGELIDKRRLRINVIMPPVRDLSSFRAPMPLDKLKGFGFHDYVINLVEAPLPVLVALCDQCHFHAVPVSLGPVRNGDVEASRKFGQYVAAGVLYRVLYSDYGARKSTVQTRQLRPARLVIGGVDHEALNQLQSQLAEVRVKISKNEESIKLSKREEAKLRAKDERLRQQLEKPKLRRNEIRRAGENFKKLELELDDRRRELQRKAQEDLDDKVRRAEGAVAASVAKLAQAAQSLGACVAGVVEAKCQLWAKKLAHLEAKARRGSVDRRLAESERVVRRALDLVDATRARLLAERSRSKALLEKAQAFLKIPDRELLTELQAFALDLSLRQLEDALDAERTKANFLPGVSAVAMEQYQQQKREIASLTRSLADGAARRERLEAEMAGLRATWVPRLRELVAQISANFSRGFSEIGGAGEVELAQHDDYDRWGVHILVKFRDSEPLQRLTGQRQSGGEKSVATILYLMGIQELARSPFRVVDEINQGMDPRNERLVHRQLVRAACKPHTAQYFLVTPKLLSDLAYHPYMKVLCVFNGEWQPARFDLRAFISRGVPSLDLKRRHTATQELAAEPVHPPRLMAATPRPPPTAGQRRFEAIGFRFGWGACLTPDTEPGSFAAGAVIPPSVGGSPLSFGLEVGRSSTLTADSALAIQSEEGEMLGELRWVVVDTSHKLLGSSLNCGYQVWRRHPRFNYWLMGAQVANADPYEVRGMAPG